MKRIIVLVVVCAIVLVAGIIRVNAGLKKMADMNRGLDYKCMSDCTGAGYSYRYCKSACSY